MDHSAANTRTPVPYSLDFPHTLPICAHVEEITGYLHSHQVLIVAGDTGCGKTTQLPKICLGAGLADNGLIGCTQPRRLAAMTVAERVARELQAPGICGYKIRFADRTGPDCRIKFMTDGVLLAESRHDRWLRAYTVLIIDEAHERSLNIDFLLGMVHRILDKRVDLKVIISSATMDTEKFSRHFCDAPVITVAGRGYPITISYSQPEDDETHVAAAIRETVILCDTSPGGDILVFLPTERDIRDTVGGLDSLLGGQCDILPLFGRLQSADQRKIFHTGSGRKIIVATNVAETSITVPRVCFVVDAGLARISRYNPRTGTTSLRVERVSRASCDQRAGRCGRTGPGHCVRLYSEADYQSRDQYTPPEIKRSNLSAVILQMISLDLGDPLHFPFIDAPSSRGVANGLRSLQELNALDQERRLTPTGRIMARLPIDPTISRIIIEGAARGALREIKVIASALAIQDPRIRPAEQEAKADQAHGRFVHKQSDFLSLFAIWQLYHQVADQVGSVSRLRKFCSSHFLSWQRMREWLDIHEQMERILARELEFHDNAQEASYAAIHQALARGFLRNIAMKKEKNRYTGTSGQELMLFPGSGLYNRGSRWLVAAELMETGRLYARCAAAIEPEWLEELGGDLCRRSWSDPHYEEKSGQVVATEKVTLFGLPIIAGRRINYGRINQDTAREARAIFIEEALIQGRLRGTYPFLEHNLQLIRHAEEDEHRFRDQRFSLDHALVRELYEQRLPMVYDRFTLNRFLKKNGAQDAVLFFQPEDLQRYTPKENDLYRFPERLVTPLGALRLSYRFEPGHDEDGVTVHIPSNLAGELRPCLLEWLVPGLIEEKVIFLLKKLPKNLRRHLVPLPDTAALLLDSMVMGHGSLYQELERAILRLRALTVRRGDWQTDGLPPHLKMRCLLEEADGRVLGASRSLPDLIRQRDQQQRALPADHPLEQRPVSVPFTTPLFDEVPDHLVGRDGKGPVWYFPCLRIDEGNHRVYLDWSPDPKECRLRNRQGLRYLYGLPFSKEIKQLRAECKATLTSHTASWLALGWHPENTTREDTLLCFVLDQLFDTTSGALPRGIEGQQRLQQLKNQSVLRSGLTLIRQVCELLTLRRQISEQLARLGHQGPCRGVGKALPIRIMEQLESILPRDFLVSDGLIDMQHCARYLKAILVRLERAELDPAKDAHKEARLDTVRKNRVRLIEFEANSALCSTLIRQYRTMAAEFEVSVFAPELGTAVPVSEKRLELLWLELEENCRRLE